MIFFCQVRQRIECHHILCVSFRGLENQLKDATQEPKNPASNVFFKKNWRGAGGRQGRSGLSLKIQEIISYKSQLQRQSLLGTVKCKCYKVKTLQCNQGSQKSPKIGSHRWMDSN